MTQENETTLFFKNDILRQKHIKTMRSVSSPPGMPPLTTSTIEPSKTPSYTKPSHSTDLNIRHSKDCRRRHTSVLVPSSSYISELSSSPISPGEFFLSLYVIQSQIKN
ncbi:hypothetical protein TNIN_412553 [Trichonephila inaurata madagascariensis]|uniref:Uncharacterized protein n=1 Tax=Trichonephila inaurata madagascariensis TaxID=2747483 RepID=A0A8X6Y7Q5_9ARAC|nr:hypothetical protein TNIN_412553 [Trichonephila inaurata madagascariensis]